VTDVQVEAKTEPTSELREELTLWKATTAFDPDDYV
jgi:hypothetical protein